MAIKLLQDDLINKIAAGEVIEKPASVVKELVENAIDAGAGSIAVRISGGGLNLIEVEDDGSGIARDEIPLAFLRHATSKIAGEDDLFNIRTLGFRGEALPSIASVSRLELYSKIRNSDGVVARSEGGRQESMEYCAIPDGTRIVVRDLFFNTPARKKFIKSPVSEGNAVYDVMVKYALSRPDISFTYNNERKTFFKTPGNGMLRDAVVTLFGADFAAQLADVKFDSPGASLSGMVASPGLCKLNRKQQFFFVNRRPVRSPILYRAVDAAYRGLLLAREYPVVVMSLFIPENSVDVNVHPQKSEVRFGNEKAVFDLVYNVIRDLVQELDTGPGRGVATGSFPYNHQNNHQNSESPSFSPQLRQSRLENWEYERTERPAGSTTFPLPVAESRSRDLEPSPGHKFRILGQCLDTYLVLEFDDSIWLLDQHAAHERVLYAQLRKAALNRHEDPAQILALPLDLELSPREMELVEANMEVFRDLGIEIEIIGRNTILLRSVPVLIAGREQEIMREILDLLQEKQVPDLKHRALAAMACKQAIKAGERLNSMEMETLVMDLLQVDDYKNCPHGRPTMIRLGRQDLERMFKR